ncbi:MAG: Rrf2 family transcriptional regulator [Patescibacteria group bacterium]|jgi:Rrf2 family protein
MFLKVPQKLHHALLLVSELAAAGRSSLSLAEVGERIGVTQGYLEQIAGPLRSAGLIRGQRGAGGGYRLALPAAKISVAAVVQAIEGPIAVIGCLQGPGTCLLSRNCRSRDVWQEVQTLILGSLKKVTVRQLVGRRRIC